MPTQISPVGAIEPIPRSRSHLLRSCLLLALLATLLGGLPKWDPNPSPDVELVQRGIPFGWIRTCEPHGLEIQVGVVEVPAVKRHRDDPIGANGTLTFPVVLEPVRLLIDIAFWSLVALAALTRPRRLLRSLLAGLVVTAVLAAIPYEFFGGGKGRGLPFPVIHPRGSDMPVLGIPLRMPGQYAWVFDLLNLARNWLVWTVMAFGGAAARARWRRWLRRRNTRGSGAMPPGRPRRA